MASRSSRSMPRLDRLQGPPLLRGLRTGAAPRALNYVPGNSKAEAGLRNASLHPAVDVCAVRHSQKSRKRCPRVADAAVFLPSLSILLVASPSGAGAQDVPLPRQRPASIAERFGNPPAPAMPSTTASLAPAPELQNLPFGRPSPRRRPAIFASRNSPTSPRSRVWSDPVNAAQPTWCGLTP